MTDSELHNTDVTCERLEDYLFGLLNQTESVAFEIHLKCCNECSQAVREERRMKNLITAAVQDAAPAPFPEMHSADKTLHDLQHVRLADRAGEHSSAAASGRAAIAAALLMLAACVMLCIVFPSGAQRTPHSGEYRVAAVPNEKERVHFLQRPQVRLDNESLGLTVDSGDPNVVVMLVFHETDSPDVSPEATQQENPELQEFH